MVELMITRMLMMMRSDDSDNDVIGGGISNSR